MKLVWFRNDLRTVDNHALYHACSLGEGVIGVAAISPEQWLRQDEAKCRVQFWLANLQQLSLDLKKLNIPLKVIFTDSNEEIAEKLFALANEHAVTGLFFNKEYAEYELLRDQRVEQLFGQNSINCSSYDCDLVMPAGTILNQQGQPYRVFTPFSRRWRAEFIRINPQPLPAPAPQLEHSIPVDPIPDQINYANCLGADWNNTLWPAGADHAHQRLQNFVSRKLSEYPNERDFPALEATSSLSPYLSIGVLSVRQCLAALKAYSCDESWFDNQWVTELIWREFYRHLLVLYPEMNRWQPFKPEVEQRIVWHQDKALFNAWCEGNTGFPLVDAGMRQLLETGWMHNRLRMVTASFLTKLLRQDWRLGARFFMQHLIDGDFASNLGGWQWSASVGADAAPYFRIFNPARQKERFDPDNSFINQWILAESRPPVIDYASARKLSIDEYNRL